MKTISLKKWLLASRAPFSITVVLPGLLGIIGAWHDGAVDPIIAALTLVGLFFANLGTNFTNDYFDYKSGVDALDEGRRYKPGAEVLLADGLKPRVVLGSAFFCLGVTAVCGAKIVVVYRPAILGFGLIGLFIAYFYTAPPFNPSFAVERCPERVSRALPRAKRCIERSRNVEGEQYA